MSACERLSNETMGLRFGLNERSRLFRMCSVANVAHEGAGREKFEKEIMVSAGQSM